MRVTLDYHFFFFNDTATTEIYTLSLHDALPICDASTPLRCAGACRSIMAAYSVPFTRWSISASWHIHQANSSGVGLKVSRCAKIFRGPSVKKAFSLGRWGNNEAASVEDSVTCVSSSEGLQ